MKTKLIVTNLFLLILLGFNLKTSGQPLSKNDITTIINGKVWAPKASISSGEQLFLEKLNLKGSLLFKGIQFDNLEFSYDISTEEIITPVEMFDKTKKIIIVNPCFLEGFRILDSSNEYEFLRGDLLHPELSTREYYQFVQFNALKYIIKRKKIKNLKSDPSVKSQYLNSNSLFIIKDDELLTINSKSDILKIFAHQKKEVKRFIRNKKLKISPRNPMDATVLLSHFDL